MIVQDTLAVLALVDLLKLILLPSVYFNRWQGFGCCTPVRYLWLQQRELKNDMNAARLLQQLLTAGLYAYVLRNRVGSIEPVVKLLA
jgi:hypothetical protein